MKYPLLLVAMLGFPSVSYPLFAAEPAGSAAGAQSVLRRTGVSIVGEDFYINGVPTYPGRRWKGRVIEGLLFNSRMVQGIFDDQNPATMGRWAYPDTKQWDPDRNTREFIEAMPIWRQHGLLAFTINLQGGSPEGYSSAQPWHNSAIAADGSLRVDALARLETILDRADDLGMVVILGIFYFGQDERIRDEAAVLKAVDNATGWILTKGYRNVLIEVNNECNVRYDHAVLRSDRVHELITRVKNISIHGHHLLAGTSYGGGAIPGEKVVVASDFILVHGNGVADPKRIGEMVRKVRALPSYWPKPIVFNEDDHFKFDQAENNFVAAVNEHASWGFFDFRMKGEGTDEGYQSPPVNWGLSSERKRGFFRLLSIITGVTPDQVPVSAGTLATPPAGANLPRPSGLSVIRLTYEGWTNAYLLGNGTVEAVIVPTVGRVMQFRFIGGENPLWENESLFGRQPDAKSADWLNFGGDKTWPAPQSQWGRVAPRTWPPPPAFDSMPVEARVFDHSVILTSPVDPYFGLRTERRIELDPVKPVMKITTRYECVDGAPRKIGVWIITQFKDPVGVFVPMPAASRFTNGYVMQGRDRPAGLKTAGGFLSLTRDARRSTKIGSDASSLLWVGEKVMMKIDNPRQAGMEYPDGGSSVEVYTNPDPARYVELETLGPLHPMKPRTKIEQVNTYTLMPRSSALPEVDAARVFGP